MTEDPAGRWQRVKAVLAEILAASEDAQPAALERICGSDLELRATIGSLLRAREPERDRVGRLGAALERTLTLAEAPERWIGRTLDRYRLVGLVGSGGMGAVYQAEPVGGGTPVAVKVLRAALPSSSARRRFDLERDRLSRLSHPSIASLFGSGVAPDGEPYLVMELVEGEAIDVFSDRRRLNIGQRLGLLRDVGGAVAHAHDHQIVHRDLKPSNILVRPEGTPVLLDFGIAKLLDPVRGGAPATLTREALAYTPAYASPEQIAGEPVSPASDVYSLGAVGYTLLAGGPPPTTVARGLRTLRRVFESSRDRQRPVAEARGTSVEELTNVLCGGLEEVLLRACDLQASRRYPSVTAFSTDVARHIRA